MGFQTLTVRTRERGQIVDITAEVRRLVREGPMADGLAVVFVPHTTAAVTINENADPDVKHDVLEKLREMVPQREGYYEHGEGNSDSHLKTMMVGNSALVIVEKHEVVLGTWQGIYFCEFDGPRTRQVLVKLISC